MILMLTSRPGGVRAVLRAAGDIVKIGQDAVAWGCHRAIGYEAPFGGTCALGSLPDPP